MNKNEMVFKENDVDGMMTLKAMSEAPRLSDWMYDLVSENLNGEILEIGSGIGNISKCFLDGGHNITLSDLRDNYLDYLNANFKEYTNLTSIEKIDLVDKDFTKTYDSLLGNYDSMFGLNVIEHIKDDSLSIQNCHHLLKEKGKLVILVPAYQLLYNNFDTALDHYRRYNKKNLQSLISANGFKIKKAYYYNFIGIFGWFVSGTILRKRIIPGGQMKIYNKLVPFWKILDKLTLNKVGLSVIVEAEKI